MRRSGTGQAALVLVAIVDAINERRDPGLTDPREKMAHEVATQLTATHRLRRVGRTHAERRRAGEDVRCIYAGWHCQLVSGMNGFVGQDVTAMISSDRDGEYQTSPIFSEIDGRRVPGGKGELTDLGVRVPLIARWKGQIAAGTQTNHVSAHWDILPTFCELAGTSVPGSLEIDGHSIASLLLGKAKDSPRDWILSLGHGYLRYGRGRCRLRHQEWRWRVCRSCGDSRGRR